MTVRSSHPRCLSAGFDAVVTACDTDRRRLRVALDPDFLKAGGRQPNDEGWLQCGDQGALPRGRVQSRAARWHACAGGTASYARTVGGTARYAGLEAALADAHHASPASCAALSQAITGQSVLAATWTGQEPHGSVRLAHAAIDGSGARCNAEVAAAAYPCADAFTGSAQIQPDRTGIACCGSTP